MGRDPDVDLEQRGVWLILNATMVSGTMSVNSFVIVLCLGAALLAMWIVARLPKIGPASLPRALAHVLAAVLLGLVTGPAMRELASLPLPGSSFVITFGIALPALTYMFHATVWLLRVMLDYFQSAHY